MISAIIINHSCDHACWSKWYKGFFVGSSELWGSKHQVINEEYCENKAITTFDAFILSTSNAWSNYAFVMFGFLEIAVAIHDFMIPSFLRSQKFSNQLRKHPEWMVFHGLVLIYGGMSSFIMHASYIEIAHTFDITGVYSMLGYTALFSVFNVFLEDLNRYLLIGEIVSKIAAPLCFVFTMVMAYVAAAHK